MYGRRGVLLVILAMLTVASHGNRRPGADDLLRESGRLRQAVDRFCYQLDAHLAGNTLRHDASSLGRAAADLESAVAGERRRGIAESLRRVEDRYYVVRHRLHSNLHLTQGEDDWYSELMRSWLDVVDSSSRLRRIARHRQPRDVYPTPGDGLITVRCKSEDYRPAECRLPARIVDLRLVKQKSRAACVAGLSYGYEGDALWVDQGCEGEFLVRVR